MLEAEEALDEDIAWLEREKLALRKKAAKLDAREGDLVSAEREQARKTFGDGVWQVGVDIDPGTYRAPAGGSCYWAILERPGSTDIRNNGGFSANQTVTLTDAWFETSDCGEWTKL